MQLRDCEDCLRRVLRVWSPHLGLLGGQERDGGGDGGQVPSGEAKDGDSKYRDTALFYVLQVRVIFIGSSCCGLTDVCELLQILKRTF